MKKVLSMILSAAFALSLAACGSAPASSAPASQAPAQPAESQPAPADTTDIAKEEPVKIAGLKGPTTMGLVNLVTLKDKGEASLNYELEMYGAADEVVPLIVQGKIDVAAIPANLAATLYKKTEGAIQVLAVNTLGVLYVVEQGDSVQSVADLKGKTVLSTGKGTTPEYVFRYILAQNGIDPDADLTIEYCSEATEVTARMAEMDGAIAVLPQPYVTAAGIQDETLRVALNLTEEWEKVSEHPMVTGVTVARKAFIEENHDAVEYFLNDYVESVKLTGDLDATAALCEEFGVVAKAPIAKKALPHCNIVCFHGQPCKDAVSNYLQVLFEADPTAVGGQMPDDGFYYLG